MRNPLKLIAALLLLAGQGFPVHSVAVEDAANAVVATGSVPDEAARVALIARLREVFGAERVIDNLSVGGVIAPPNWSAYATKTILPGLKSVSRGRLTLDGTNLSISGQVPTEAFRQQLASDLAAGLNPSYIVKNGLQVAAAQQSVLDKTLGRRTIEFETGSASLTPSGKAILDEMATAMKTLESRKFEVVGHTDSQGSREKNVALSAERAKSVKDYLTAKGIDPTAINTSGMGPNRPVASNATEAGRARNRRIEFLVN